MTAVDPIPKTMLPMALNEDNNISRSSKDDAGSTASEGVLAEIALLRHDIAELSRVVSEISSRQEPQRPDPADDHPWLRIAATMAATLAIGKLVQRLRLGAAGAAAVPLIVAQANRYIWR